MPLIQEVGSDESGFVSVRSAVFTGNGSQTIEVMSNEKGFASVEVTDEVREQISITADVQFVTED